MEKLLKNYEQAVNDIIDHFCEKQEVEFDYWIDDIVGEVACIGGYYFFNLTDIVHDIKANAPKGLIFQWQDESVESFEFSDNNVKINYRSYIKGARFEK